MKKIIFILVLLLLTTGEIQALVIGPGYDYAFKFTFSNGDYYTGKVMSFSGSLYQVGQSWTHMDEHGMLGTYKIIGKTDNEMSSLNEGNVWVDNYYDRETLRLFSPVNGYAGSKSLGSEVGYILKDGVPECKFGQGYYEADVAGSWYPYVSPYAERSESWYQWLTKEPAASNPAYDTTGNYAGLNQSGSVWYLAGSYVGAVTRSITIPYDKSLFFPVVTEADINGIEVPSMGIKIDDEPTARLMVYDDVNTFDKANISCTLDGKAVTSLVRTQSRKFNVPLSANNIVGVPAGNWDKSYADGYYVSLSPLAVGAHTLHFAATGKWALDVTYNITVEPKPEPSSRYSFTYAYNNGLGDSYKGYFFAPTGYNGYKVGYIKDVIDENKQTGKYTIIAALNIGLDKSKNGQVFVTEYTDRDQSGKTFKPVNYSSYLGTNFLGSELGYIKNANVGVYRFGKGFYEADAGDTYTYRYTYGNGDYYEGKFYRDPLSTTYYPGKKISKINELKLTGYYEIKGVGHSKVASTSYGQVFVNKYYDGDKTGQSVPVVNPTASKGKTSLGSEVGYIKNTGVPVYMFGKGYYEADAGDTYTYRYTYGNGDYYEGIVYRDPLSTTYYPGRKIFKVNELRLTGYYEIKGVSHSKVASTSYGQVFVKKYYDGDKTGQSVPVVNPTASKGKTSLGSEVGYIKNTGVPVYMFGKGYYEADAGDTYTFRYTYGNGDYYEGRVYRDPLSTVYYPGQKISKVNELGKTGYYEIKGVSHSKVASSLYGKVYVTKYYDGDKTTPKAYTGAQLLPANSMYAWFGAGYLKSEQGYIGSRPPIPLRSPNFFGGGFYEADL